MSSTLKTSFLAVATAALCFAACTSGGDPDDDGGDRKGSGSATKPPSGAYVLNEAFDAGDTGGAPPTPFTVSASPAGSVAVQELPFAANKSVAIAKPDATGKSSLDVSFAKQTGRIAVESSVMAAETAGFKAIPYIADDAGNTIASLSMQDGNINARIGATSTLIQPFVANTWYRIRTVIDTNAGTFDLYIDGVRKEHNVALRAAAANVAAVSFYMDGVNTGTLYVDNVKVYNEAAYIGAAPSPQFVVTSSKYGAKPDGTTDDTAAIQKAINAAANTGGSVVLSGGTFLSGTLTLQSNMTFYIDSSAVLLGIPKESAYAAQKPGTGNTQLSNTQRALLYAPNVSNLTIDGGGVIDGNGDSYAPTTPPPPNTSVKEADRPLLIWSVLSKGLTVQNLYLRKGAVWSLVSMETDNVLINNINLQSNGITHDGIDIVDGTNITVQNSAVNAGDDAMCIKSGVRRGIQTMTVKNSVFSGNSGGSNGIKVGTATYGAFKDITLTDNYVKDVQYAAMAVESRDGADVDGITFERIWFANTGAAFFVYLAQQETTHPTGDKPKYGSITNVTFSDIHGSTATYAESPHQGSLITGQAYTPPKGVLTNYEITNLLFTNVDVTFDGGDSTVPAAPPEATAGQYPESNMFKDLPASAYYLRHVDGVTFDNVTTTIAATDARPTLATSDATDVTGAP